MSLSVATFLQGPASLFFEADENQQREDFTPTEAKAVRDYLLPKEREAARERCVEGGKTKGSTKLVDPDRGKAVDKAAAATGYSPESLRKIDVVVEAAEADPEKYGPVVEEMDRTGKVDPAYRKVVEKKKLPRVKRGSYDDWRELVEITKAIKEQLKQIGTLKVDAPHKIPARTLCEDLSGRFKELARKIAR